MITAEEARKIADIYPERIWINDAILTEAEKGKNSVDIPCKICGDSIELLTDLGYLVIINVMPMPNRDICTTTIKW